MTRRLLLLFLLLLLGAGPLEAQPLRLSLTDAVALALENGPAAEIALLGYERDSWAYQAARSELRPSVSLQASTPGIERSIDNIVQDDGSSRYVSQSRAFSSMNLSVSQPVPYTGGQVFVSSGLSRVDVFGEFDTFQWSSTPLIVGLTQPLFGFNQLGWERRRAPLAYQAATRAYAEAREQIAVETTGLFFAAYLAEMNVRNAEFNLAVNDTIFTLAQGRFEIGAIAENELLQSELQRLIASSSLADARIARQAALQELRTYLGVAYDTPIEILPPNDILGITLDPEESVARALRYRSDFLQHELDRLEAAESVARARTSNRFTANLTARYGLNQTSPTFEGLYADPLSQQRLSINLNVPIFQSGRGQAEVESARAAQAQVERRTESDRVTLERQVFFEAVNFEQIQRQVTTAARADTIATRRFEVAKNRYLIGRIDITDLFNAQREKDDARRSYIEALRRYWTSYYTLRRLTLYDIVRDVPLVRPSN